MHAPAYSLYKLIVRTCFSILHMPMHIASFLRCVNSLTSTKCQIKSTSPTPIKHMSSCIWLLWVRHEWQTCVILNMLFWGCNVRCCLFHCVTPPLHSSLLRSLSPRFVSRPYCNDALRSSRDTMCTSRVPSPLDIVQHNTRD